MNCLKTYILYFCLFTSVLASLAQKPTAFRNLSTKDGLSQTSVFAIAQDEEGFMWFGTRDGLNKYNGYNFKHYKHQAQTNSLVANDIRSLYFDAYSGHLWVGTIAGLSRYRPDADDFTNYTSEDTSTGLSVNVIRTIYRDQQQRLWVGTAEGLNLYDDLNDRFTTFKFPSPEGDAQQEFLPDIKAIVEDDDGTLWFGTKGGLFRLTERDSIEFEYQHLPLSDSHIKTMVRDTDGNLWIGTNEGGVNLWNRRTNELRFFLEEKNGGGTLSHNTIRTICTDLDGQIWVGTFDGLNLFDPQKQAFENYRKTDLLAPGLSDNSIRSLFVDDRGSLWIGTYYGGINYLDTDNSRFTNFSYKPYINSLSGNVVSSFAEDAEGNLWIGTEGGGLNFYDQKTGQFEHFKALANTENSLSGNNVKQLLLDGNNLWIGTFQEGLNLFDLEQRRFLHFKHDPDNPNSLSSNNVYGLHKEGDYLWILTYGGGLDIYHIPKKKFYNFNPQSQENGPLSSELARVFLLTTDQTLWIGTERGINKTIRDPDGFPESFEVYLPDEKIYTLQEDHHHNIWVGTISNGLYRLDPSTGVIDHFTEQNGLPGNTVFGILEDEQGQLWLSTNQGLSKFDPLQEKFTNYNHANGLENLEYNFNAYYKTRSGEFLFGGIHGFTRFNPASIQNNDYIPSVVFTALKLNNKVISVGDESGLLQQSINETQVITFAYKEANFSLGFAALDYFSPENNRYAFMMEGIDKDWNYSRGESEAIYTIQQPGDYTFRLKGANSDGLWNPEERQIRIVVLPPPWRTGWAYLLYFFILAGITYSLIRFIRLRHKLQLEQLAKVQQEELHEVKMRFFTNITHEFRTPLTLILGPLHELITQIKGSEGERSKLLSIERNTQRLLNLVNQVLTFRKLETDHEPIQVVQDNLVTFLQEIFLSFKESARMRFIDYQFQCSDDEMLVWYDPDKLEKVCFNLLSNAFKFTPDEGSISMSVVQKMDSIFIKVKDSGVGISPEFHDQIFKRFYEKGTTSHSHIKGSGIGLAISKQLIELHNGEITVESEEGAGTTFIVRLPTGHAHFAEAQMVKNKPNRERVLNFQPLPPPGKPSKTEEVQDQEDSRKPLLLIIEDNADIRNYIVQLFKNQYRTITAGDGEEGLHRARTRLPDLIICDVMMPKMDGITMCSELKNDLEISHIPVILLTARTADLFKIEGLETGADDYITKPFNPEELSLRVRNLIQARLQLRHKFARVFALEPKEITLTSADEKFMEKAMQVAERHISNVDFTVEQFAHDLAVSRPLLFTKLKVLTDQTPNNFIKTIRLKRAAQLLVQQKVNISEVAYLVGFRDPKYFRKCFQKHFDSSPSDFIKQHQENLS